MVVEAGADEEGQAASVRFAQTEEAQQGHRADPVPEPAGRHAQMQDLAVDPPPGQPLSRRVPSPGLPLSPRRASWYRAPDFGDTQLPPHTRVPQALARLSTPRERGVSERSLRRSLCKGYEEYASQVANALAPEAATTNSPSLDLGGGASPRLGGRLDFGDVWRTASEDGYRSAVFHAAVRCRELSHSAGGIVEIFDTEDGHQLVFNGQRADSETHLAPDLSRLHTACFIFEELCKVSSPLQDTLRFLFRELCHCIFEDFVPGSDVLLLKPFFMRALSAKQELDKDRQRSEQLLRRCDGQVAGIRELERQVARLEKALQAERNRSQESDKGHTSLISERDRLRAEVAHLQESDNLRADELRDLSSEFAKLQGLAFTGRLDLDRTQKDLSSMTTQSKERHSTILELQRTVHDLQAALALTQEADAPVGVDAPRSAALPGLSAEQERELGILRKQQSVSSIQMQRLSAEDRAADGRRLLRYPMPDGQMQLVMMKSSVEDDDRTIQPLVAEAKGPPVLLVSKEIFAAMSISLSLPNPPDLLQFSASDDQGVIKEVQQQVQTLVDDHRLLLERLRLLRKELKTLLELVPEWNVDEIRGILRSVLVFDPAEVQLVPSPVLNNSTLVGLGDGEKVPSFLRFTGTFAVRKMEQDEVRQLTQDIWLSKTQSDLQRLKESQPTASLGTFFGDHYLPTAATDFIAQMDFSYNFLLALRGQTTLADMVNGEPPKPEEQEAKVDFQGDTPKDERALYQRSGTRAWKQNVPSVHFHADSELLHRCLLGELHEDVFHDQTAMLAAFACLLAAMSERFIPASVASGDFRRDASAPCLLGLAELSAIIRMFFPAKPREHMSALKQVVVAYTRDEEEGDGGSAHDASSERGGTIRPRLESSDTGEPTWKAVNKTPPVVDAGRLLGVSLCRGDLRDKEAFLSDLISQPSPIVVELRRQHLLESFMFLDRVRKAFRVHGQKTDGTIPGTEGPSARQVQVTPRQADVALAAADQQLSEDQRAVYLLRGFGRRMPDRPSEDRSGDGPLPTPGPSPSSALSRKFKGSNFSKSATSATEAPGGSRGLNKLRPLFRERVHQLVESGATVSIDEFIKRLASTGVTRGARVWQPDVTAAQVAQESGLEIMRSTTAAAALEEFVGTAAVTFEEPVMEGFGTTRDAFNNYMAHMEAGNDIHEFSVGYPGFALSYWLGCQL